MFVTTYERIYYYEWIFISCLCVHCCAFLMIASEIDSYASDEDIVGKVKSEGSCDDGFSMSGNITTIIGSRSQIHFLVETCC